jgi:actin-related protein
MGFSEFDRIRRKNKLWNQADEVIQHLRSSKLTDADICLVIQDQLAMNPTDTRNEIYSTVLRIVGGSNEGAQ